jgi:hypothetical protein
LREINARQDVRKYAAEQGIAESGSFGIRNEGKEEGIARERRRAFTQRRDLVWGAHAPRVSGDESGWADTTFLFSIFAVDSNAVSPICLNII